MKIINFKHFFESRGKEHFAIVVRSLGQAKKMREYSLKYLDKDIYDYIDEDLFKPQDFTRGIALVNCGAWLFADELKSKKGLSGTAYFKEVSSEEVTFNEEDIEHLLKRILGFSFRYNKERKTVTLYESGTKVRVVKCHDEDVFDWKIGLALCLYRHKGMCKNAEVSYMKSILPIKKFAEYILMREYKYKKEDYEAFLRRVKDAEVYDEIYI